MSLSRRGFSLDPLQGLSEGDEMRLVRLGAELGYESAWTPSGADAAAFERCLSWHRESGLATGILVVPASGRPPGFYAEQAIRVWEGTGGRFVLGVGSGWMERPATAMRAYLTELRGLLPAGLPVYLAALGPLMLRLAGEVADGVALNWCSAEQVAWSRRLVERAAKQAGRTAPPVVEYIRTAVDPDPIQAARALVAALRPYALGLPAYRRHFERKGLVGEMAGLEADRLEPGSELVAASGACGRPGEVRDRFQHLAEGLDQAIVRVLATVPGDFRSARRVLEECRP